MISFHQLFELFLHCTNQNGILSLPFTGTINKIRRKVWNQHGMPSLSFRRVAVLILQSTRHGARCKREKSYSYTCNIFVSIK